MSDLILGRLLAFWILASLLGSASLDAQSVCENYPEWQPATELNAIFLPVISYDQPNRHWYYRYWVVNSPTSKQALLRFWLKTPASIERTLVPDSSWFSVSENHMEPDDPLGPRADFSAEPLHVSMAELTHYPPHPAQLAPGDSIFGLGYVSTFGPIFYAVTQSQGYVRLPFVDVESTSYCTPTPEQNSVRLETSGAGLIWFRNPPVAASAPTVAEDLLALGLVEMPPEVTSIPAETMPPVVSVALPADLSVVDLSTLRVTLNGRDVTQHFHPVAPDKPHHLVGVMSPLQTPLVQGDNLVSASIQGILVGATVPSLDADEAGFKVTSLRWPSR